MPGGEKHKTEPSVRRSQRHFATLVIDRPVAKREQRIILAQTDVTTGLEFGAALANQNGSRGDLLATEFLHAAKLWIAVPTVSRRSLTFFVSHNFRSRISPIPIGRTA